MNTTRRSILKLLALSPILAALNPSSKKQQPDEEPAPRQGMVKFSKTPEIHFREDYVYVHYDGKVFHVSDSSNHCSPKIIQIPEFSPLTNPQ